MIEAHDLHLSFGARTLLAGARLSVKAGERVALMGDNGAGKSTLMKCLADLQVLDDGEVRLRSGARLGLLAQSPSFDDEEKRVRDTIADALILTPLEESRGIDPTHRIDEVISRLNLDALAQSPLKELSGGERRRTDLARTILGAADVLLLDEPTNHLDRGGIQFLVEHLSGRTGALLFVSHDRAFTDQLCTRIVELNRGVLHGHPAPVAAYLTRRLERETTERSTLHKKARLMVQELAWLRRGPKARTTKSEARIGRAEALIADVQDGRQALKERRLEVQQRKEARLAKTILEFKGVGVALPDGRQLFDDLDLIVVEGERWGIVGPNGAGKTSLLNALQGQSTLTVTGEIVVGGRTKFAVFDQLARSLDDDKTLKEVLTDGDYVASGEERVHVVSYLERWLFHPEDKDRKIGTLSGGEKNRLLFARLFASDANAFLLDEPTNDLDAETLGVLEENLASRGGVALIVSHDAQFLDKVATGILSYEDETVVAYQGDYTQWFERRNAKTTDVASAARKAKAEKKKTTAKKRSYNEEREYAGIEENVLTAEAEVERLSAQLEDPDVQSDGRKLVELTEKLTNATAEVERLYARWQELER